MLITHEATRTGAPMIVLQFVRWLRTARPGMRIDIVALAGGELEADLRAIADRYYSPSSTPIPIQALRGRVLAKMRRGLLGSSTPPAQAWQERHLIELAGNGYELIYANTVVSVPFASRLAALAHRRVKLLAHVHELNVVMATSVSKLGQYLDRIDHFIAASGLVKEHLEQHWQVTSSRIDVVHEFSSISGPLPAPWQDRPHILEVGGAGTVHWRKGDDVFIQVARYLRDHYPDVPAQFTWVGMIGSKQAAIVRGDLEKMGLLDRVRFVGEREDPVGFFRAMDVFLLPSREDPFPLVCIEMGMLGRPIICFDRATGIAEVVRLGGGAIVPYLNIEAMAEKVADYHTDRERMRADGAAAHELFSRFTADRQCPLILECMESLCRS
ncbi:MAG: glycosyltransferase family 4 protein [Flavobacteriales bacterium]